MGGEEYRSKLMAVYLKDPRQVLNYISLPQVPP